MTETVSKASSPSYSWSDKPYGLDKYRDSPQEERSRYGIHLLFDLHGCNAKKFNRDDLAEFFHELCKVINMDDEDFHFWDDVGVPIEEQQTDPKTKGTSIGGVCKKLVGLQFILTSTIVIHTLDLIHTAYVDIFTCKDFDVAKAEKYVKNWFETDDCRVQLVERI